MSARRRRSRFALPAGAAGLLVLAMLLGSSTAAQAAVRVGHVPVLPAGARRLGALPSSVPVQVTVTLQPRDPAALAAYAQAVSTPGSSVYHRYLAVSEFAQRFGSTQAQLDVVAGALRARGLQPGPVTPNRLAFSLTAPAARLASALSTGFARYRLADGRTAFANTSAPALPPSAAGLVQGLLGLSSLALRSPRGRVHTSGASPRSSSQASPSTGGPSPCAAATVQGNLNGSYTANQIASAYRLSSLYGAGALGQGATVALYELEPYSSADISHFQSCYGTAASVSNVAVDGGAGTGYGRGEAALDVENVIGLAPQAAIRVYQGPNTNAGAYDTYAKIVTDNTAQVVSTSWGLCEALLGSSVARSENTLFQEAAVQGQSVFAASGDSGADDCGSGSRTVDDPASQPYVTGVGGTSLQSIGPPPSEAAWDTTGGAGGGGVSTFWGRPSYQSAAAVPQSSATCGSSGTVCREVPDVAASADPASGYVVYFHNRWTTLGGTSGAAPVWAALTALANSSSSCAGTEVGFANPALYRAASSGYANDFNDITSGNNSYNGVTGFTAGTGYDMASGLGTPQGAALAAALCANGADSVSFINPPGNQSSFAGAPITPFTVTATSTTGAPVTYSGSGLPPGIAIGKATGNISGTPTVAGTYNVILRAVDTNSRVGTTAFTWVVDPSTGFPSSASQVVVVTPPSRQTGRVHVSQRLQVHARDRNGLPLRYRASGLPSGLTVNAKTGLISGRPRRAQQSTVTVTASDTAGNRGQATFRWTIAGAPGVSRLSLSASSGAAPILAFRLTAGQYGAAIRALSLKPRSRGVSFSGQPTAVRRGLAVSLSTRRVLRTNARTHRGVLGIILRRTRRGLSIRVSAPELQVAQGLYGQIASRRRPMVKFVLTVTDRTGVRTSIALSVRGRF